MFVILLKLYHSVNVFFNVHVPGEKQDTCQL